MAGEEKDDERFTSGVAAWRERKWRRSRKKHPGIIKAENGHLFNPLIFFLFAVREVKDCVKKKTSANV